MARGFHGMKDDFMEIISHIIELSCCSVGHVDNDDDSLLLLPQPTAGEFTCLKVSQAISASNKEVRDAAAAEDAPLSAFAYTAPVDDGAGPSFRQAEYFIIDQGVEPSFATVGNKLGPTFESEENFWRGYHTNLNIKLNENDSESLPSLQENSFILEDAQGTDKERYFESASDIDDYHCYCSEKEGEGVVLQKHILVENHMPSIPFSKGLLQLRKRPHMNFDDEELRGSHEVDGCEYVIVSSPSGS